MLIVNEDSGKVKSYQSHPIKKRHLGTQTGESFVKKARQIHTRTTSDQTPTKRRKSQIKSYTQIPKKPHREDSSSSSTPRPPISKKAPVMFSHEPSKKQGPSSASRLLQSHSPMTRKSPLARPTSQVLSKNIIKKHEPLPRALHTSSTANKSSQSLLPRKPSMLTSIRNLPGKKATRKPIKSTKENPACNKCALFVRSFMDPKLIF